jgi:hypothetical protein
MRHSTILMAVLADREAFAWAGRFFVDIKGQRIGALTGLACVSMAPRMRPMPPASARRTAKLKFASSPRTKKP